jgi:mRNA interferase RelE/StbE
VSDTPYTLLLAPGPRRAIAEMPVKYAAAVMEFVTGALLDNPQRVGKPLGLDLTGYHGARRGDYRVVYRIDAAAHTVHVVRIDHRRDVYRSKGQQ